MKSVFLHGVLMDNNEFIFKGKSIFLTKEEIKQYTKEVVCPKCDGELSPSQLEDYTYSCDECDEDFYKIEVSE